VAGKSKSTKVTPLMKQYFEIKAKHPDALLLFRVGDFYETFGEDAVKAANVLGIVLTARNNGGSKIELAGFPYHSVDVYLPKLVKAGFRVAICEQLEKPSKEKKIVKRGVTDLVTPGVTYHDSILTHNKNNFLASVVISKSNAYGVSFLDISTGEFLVAQGGASLLRKLIQSFEPTEILVSRSHQSDLVDLLNDPGLYIYPLDEWIYSEDHAIQVLSQHFKGKSFKGFGIQSHILGQIAAGGIIQYLEESNQDKLSHITSISRIQSDDFLWLDRFTIRNLELIHSQHESGKSLFSVMNKTTSPMGARMLKKWIMLPLVSVHAIEERLKKVSHLVENNEKSETLKAHISRIGDLERLVSKISTQKINPREVAALGKSLLEIPEILTVLATDPIFDVIREQLHPCTSLVEIITHAIVEDPPTLTKKGFYLKEGFDVGLDEVKYIINNSKALLVEIQQREATATGITNLKIGFNNVFGYYLEVTNKYKNLGLIPENWVRKQTLTNAERYITEELKTLESKILNAEEKMLELEFQLYTELVNTCTEYIQPIQENARLIAELDVLIGFSRLANYYNYSRPTVNDSKVIDIKKGRHPVIESQLEHFTSYVPNDLYLDDTEQQIMMITGPNMSGKSAVLRQTALICLMAQMGSYVPAESATLGYIDKLFTRVGASDNISSGESTFMVEMTETSSIMNNISDRSLVLLDEIGRGTSTYDGISIAWSIAEYLHELPDARPKTLFATHYHELNELANQHERIQNFNISTKEVNNTVVFLRTLVKGGSQHSFGIHVAKLASMPHKIIHRAAQILIELEKKSINKESSETLKSMAATPTLQLDLFQPAVGQEVVKDISTLTVETMTPVECMMKLIELKDKVDKL